MLEKIKHSKLLIIMLCFTIWLLPVAIFAATCTDESCEISDAYVSYSTPDIYINGYYVYTDISPISIEGRTLVPVRAITEALGCKVEWYQNTQAVNIRTSDGNLTITMNVGSYYADIYHDYGYDYSYDYVYMDTPANIYNGRIMVPLRFIAETLGLQVEYDEFTGNIYIKKA